MFYIYSFNISYIIYYEWHVLLYNWIWCCTLTKSVKILVILLQISVTSLTNFTISFFKIKNKSWACGGNFENIEIEG